MPLKPPAHSSPSSDGMAHRVVARVDMHPETFASCHDLSRRLLAPLRVRMHELDAPDELSDEIRTEMVPAARRLR